MRLISILAGIVMGFAATSLILTAVGSMGRPVGIWFIAPSILVGALLGLGTARRVDARETRLDGQRIRR